MLIPPIKSLLQVVLLTLIAFINGEVNAMEFTSQKIHKTLNYQTVGSGKPLVMISDATKWDPALQDLLGKHYQLIILDNVNLSKPSAAADSIADLMHTLGLDHAYILGLSGGSVIAEQLAVRHPELIEKLILCAPCLEGMNLQALTRFHAPTLLAGGRDDATAPPEHLKKISAYIPHAWTAYFEGEHDFLFQGRKHFADLVILFLEQK